MQRFALRVVFLIVLENNPNIYLLTFAALGWAVSLYFGFFRYRQYVWSRNKVRYDLLQKIDQRRSDLAAKLLMFCEISTSAKPRKARLRSLLRRYLSVLSQVDFYEREGVFDEAILSYLRAETVKDLEQLFSHDNELKTLADNWLKARASPGSFTSTLNFEQNHQ